MLQGCVYSLCYYGSQNQVHLESTGSDCWEATRRWKGKLLTSYYCGYFHVAAFAHLRQLEDGSVDERTCL